MWQTKDNNLYKKFNFKDFTEAVAFINKVALLAEQMNHHPTIKNTYNTVEIWLTTHDEGNKVTSKDKDLSDKIDQLFSSAPLGVAPPAVHRQIKLYCDGGSRGNPGPSASGYVLMDMEDNIIMKAGVYLGITTNNQAEYNSLKFGLEEAKKLGAREVDVYMDSLLVINQMKGLFKVKNRDLWPIHQSISENVKSFKKVTFNHVPREMNKLADAEVNETLDAEKL